MSNKLLSGVALAALALPAAAFAQSTGTVDAEEATIVVTATRTNTGVGGVVAPDDTKAKAVLTQEVIARQRPGQTIADIINLNPGVSFTNNDPFGSAGGTLVIRGFDSTRISQTFDGLPLNDTGNYALYSNQQLDPELIEQVNVNLGTTDVDSPTAGASGSTVNYRSMNPTRDFGARLMGSAGDFQFFRIFGQVNTGEIGPWGTRAWFAASNAQNRVASNNFGRIHKQQYNAKLYQPIGDNGDFISIAGHYNQNRNNFFGSIPLRLDTAGNRVVPNRFPFNRDEDFYVIAPCQLDVPQAGVADVPTGCGTSFDYRFNPSNTGNIRINSRFTLAPGVILTIDPGYQYVKANGGGTVNAIEGLSPLGQVGYIGSSAYFGRDLNGDGDIRDRVTVLAPSQTRTHRYSLTSSLRWDFQPGSYVRVGYAHDYGNHRQTGETHPIALDGRAIEVFPVNNPLLGANGVALQKRDRQSLAILDQVFGEVRARIGDALTVQAGLAHKWFKRDLNNYCFTTSVIGDTACFGLGNTAANAIYAAANPTVQGPQRRVIKFARFTPNLGVTFKLDNAASIRFNYSKGIQVPGTDNLYQLFFYPAGTAAALPTPETTDNFDLGVRYATRNLQINAGPWYTKFENRLSQSYDPVLDRSIYTNLGRVDRYGVDVSVAYRPVPELLLYAFGSALKSKIKDNVQTGLNSFAQTAGKRESGAPVFTLGGRVQGDFGPVSLGAQAKHTGRRYINDQNLPITVGGVAIYPAAARPYTVVDLDARVALGWAGLNDKTYLQFNLSNVFNKLYPGNFGGNLETSRIPFVQIGAPRAFSATLNMQF